MKEENIAKNPFDKYSFLDVDEDLNIEKILELNEKIEEYNNMHDQLTDNQILELRAEISTLSYVISLKNVADWWIGALKNALLEEGKSFERACRYVETNWPQIKGGSTVGEFARKLMKQDSIYLDAMAHEKKINAIFWELKRKLDKSDKVLDSMQKRNPHN